MTYPRPGVGEQQTPRSGRGRLLTRLGGPQQKSRPVPPHGAAGRSSQARTAGPRSRTWKRVPVEHDREVLGGVPLSRPTTFSSTLSDEHPDHMVDMSVPAPRPDGHPITRTAQSAKVEDSRRGPPLPGEMTANAVNSPSAAGGPSDAKPTRNGPDCFVAIGVGSQNAGVVGSGHLQRASESPAG
jgi:hypothetical protein